MASLPPNLRAWPTIVGWPRSRGPNEVLMSRGTCSHINPMRRRNLEPDIPHVFAVPAKSDGIVAASRRPGAAPVPPRAFRRRAERPAPRSKGGRSLHRREGKQPLSSRTACAISYASGCGTKVNLLATPFEGDHPETVEICFGSTVCMQAAASGRSLSNLRSTAPHNPVGAKPAKGEPEWLQAP